MDPTTAQALEELRQVGACMPGTSVPPAAAFGFPVLSAPPRDVPMRSMIGIPEPDQQAAV
jgi:hypothetical protein